MAWAENPPIELFDIIIVGAGISGINNAYRVQTELPSANYTILEARGGIGGTWDLFRYPGFRSDSDHYTFGFTWRPWAEQKIIHDGYAIRDYIRESAALYGIDQKIRFNHKLLSANWSSDQQAWNLVVDEKKHQTNFHARFVILSTGYYDYEEALSASIPGIENFTGTVAHTQFWPEDLDYKDKNITVIGSGATAVTVIPALAEKASHVTMLQRSPTYILAGPTTDPFCQWASTILPYWLAHRLARIRILLISFLFYQFCAFYPLAARFLIKKATLKELPSHIPHDPHFTPRYNPWEQRLCLCPDGDFFAALRAGKASVVTDTIATVTATGIQLASGQTLDTDIIVTATGLKIQLAGGARISVDNVPVTIGQKLLWKGVMLQDVPNLAIIVGFLDVSWTVGADTTALFVCRLLKAMKAKEVTSAVPKLEHMEGMKVVSALDQSSTYVVRGQKEVPRAGDRAPWKPRTTYFSGLWGAKFGNLTEGLRFEKVST